jgi:hypothetical protein
LRLISVPAGITQSFANHVSEIVRKVLRPSSDDFSAKELLLFSSRVGGLKALAEVIAAFIDGKRAAGPTCGYLRVQTSVVGLFLFQGAQSIGRP